jgi:hypothetical protein
MTKLESKPGNGCNLLLLPFALTVRGVVAFSDYVAPKVAGIFRDANDRWLQSWMTEADWKRFLEHRTKGDYGY